MWPEGTATWSWGGVYPVALFVLDETVPHSASADSGTGAGTHTLRVLKGVQRPAENLGRCAVPQNPAGTVIEQLLYPLDLCGIERLEIRRLREILTDKAVGVFVQPALPRMIWRGKEEQGRQRLG